MSNEVVISSIHHKGSVARTQSDEYVEITNRGADIVRLDGWVLDGGDAGQRFTFRPGTRLAPGQSIRVYTNEVHPETGGFTFGAKRSIWNDTGDVARLRDPFGKVVSQFGYGNQKLTEASPEPAAPAAETSAQAPLSAQEVWARVKAHWSGFEFMWQPGNTEEEIAAAEARLGVKLPARVRELMRECSGPAGGFPEREGHGLHADACLLPVTQWMYLDEWEDPRARQYVMIGSNDHMQDEGGYVLLDPGTGEVFGLFTDRDQLFPEGSFETWLQNHRMSPDNYRTDPEDEERELDEGETVAEWIASRHSGYLYLHESAWKTVERQFIEAVNRLRGD